MTRIHPATCLASLFLATSLLHAQSVPESVPASEEGMRLVRIATLNSVEANQEFQRNVQVMQAAREQAIALKAQLDAAQDPQERETLTKELEAHMERLNENNRKMVESYGFSLTRNYVMVIEVSHIYMSVSEEEAEQLEAFMKNAPSQKP